MLNNSILCTYKYFEKEKTTEKEQDFSLFFSYDPDRYLYKPTSKKEIGRVSNRLLDNFEYNGNIYQLARLVASGHAVSPAIFIEERKQRGFFASNMLFLDIDYGISIEEFEKVSTDHELYPNLIYLTYSHTSEKPRFRAVYILDRLIQNQKVYRYLLKGLGNLFPQVDPKCLEPARMFFGTNASEIVDFQDDRVITVDDPYRYLDPEVSQISKNLSVSICSHHPNSYDHVKTVIDSTYYQPFDTNGNHSRRICSEDPEEVSCIYYNKEYRSIDTSRVHPIENVTDSIRPKSDVKRENLLYINRSSHYTSLLPVSMNPEGIQRVEKVNFEDLATRSDMFREFVSGEIWEKTHYRHIFNLAYNLRWVKGGLKYMLEVMTKNNQRGITQYADNEFSCVKLAKSSTYNYNIPSLFTMKDLYPDDYERWGNIYNAITNQKRGSVEPIKENLPTPISLSDGENLLKQTFQKVKNQKTRGTLDLISAAIGLGKTRLLINEIDHKQSGTIIAFVTHQLKNQFIKDLTKKGFSENIDFIVSPQVPTFDNQNHNIHLEHLFLNQEFKKARQYILSIYQTEKKSEDAQLAKEYHHKYTGFIDSLIYGRFEGTIITTHAMCHYFDFGKLSPRHQTYIFDEDLFAGGLISTDYFLLDDLKSVAESGASCSGAFKDLLCRDVGIYDNDIDVSIASIQERLRASEGANNKGTWKKLLELKQSRAFAITKEVKKGKNAYKLLYSKRIKLKPSMKYIVLSGTAPEDLYQFEGIKTKIHNQCKFIKQKGKLIQYTKKSFSQSSLSRSDKLPDNPDNIPIITFMKHKEMFENSSENIHIYNSLGYNDLAGKDCMVIGTPHMNPYALALLAIEAGLSVDLKDKGLLDKSQQGVEYNGLKFKLFTFVNETLRNLSNQLTESELQQTVGRARLLRTDATVHLYSNFPLWMADEFVY